MHDVRGLQLFPEQRRRHYARNLTKDVRLISPQRRQATSPSCFVEHARFTCFGEAVKATCPSWHHARDFPFFLREIKALGRNLKARGSSWECLVSTPLVSVKESGGHPWEGCVNARGLGGDGNGRHVRYLKNVDVDGQDSLTKSNKRFLICNCIQHFSVKMMTSLFRRFIEPSKGEPEVAVKAEVTSKPYYQIGQQIGKGSFAEVRRIKAKTEKEEDRQLAVKIIQKSENLSTNKVIIREVKALKKLVHPNIINFHEVLRKGDKFYIIMEFAEGGDLFQRLDKHGAIPDPEGRLIFTGIISGLHYCHQLSIAHRDLKLENILLDRYSRPKISDFGFSRSCLDDQGKRILSKTFCGSLYYAGPEILMGTPYNPTLADIWSCGVILYAMMFNAMPFLEKDVKVLVQKELNRDVAFPASKGVSESCVELIKWMIEPDVIKRATTSRIMASSDWLKKIP